MKNTIVLGGLLGFVLTYFFNLLLGCSQVEAVNISFVINTLLCIVQLYCYWPKEGSDVTKQSCR